MLKTIILIFLLSFTWLAGPIPAVQAEEPAVVTVDVEADFEAAQAIGILLSEKGLQQKLPAILTRISPVKYRVSFNYSPEQITPSTVATALLILENGKVVMTEPQLFSIVDDNIVKPAAIIPPCPPNLEMEARLHGQEGNYQALINIRQERRDVVRSKIGLHLTQERLDELSSLERGFGLARQHPLSPELDPLELLDRLTQLHIAIKNYQYYRSMTKEK